MKEAPPADTGVLSIPDEREVKTRYPSFLRQPCATISDNPPSIETSTCLQSQDDELRERHYCSDSETL